ncbi:hypothetical protein GE061_004932 [Apolygus lucorum]|uniref:Peptidase S1 domain-containing protein n=1 Tax=Apolygus lucorum TaxID=248454 RepID=A0A8S9WW93_APOLU|nr:hypothetical protein GE061_004932 [Apolygus lucorum]
MTLFLANLVRLTEAGSRRKRILNGLEAEESTRDFYKPFRYFVFLSKAPRGRRAEEDPDTYHWWQAGRWFTENGATVEWQHCGGSLITPNVVQTACHCLAFFSIKPLFTGDIYNHAKAFNVWEDRIYSYIGANELKNMPQKMLVPKHYLVHEQCGQLIFHIHYAAMDFGMIVAKDSVVERVPTAAISYAPTYNAADILKYYYENVNVERMCLVIGHGQWLVEYLDGLYPHIKPVASEVQRWGWRTIMNRADCMAATFNSADAQLILEQFYTNYDYVVECTWVCLQINDINWKRYRFRFGSGDSGGPVTCDGAHFAVVSMAQDERSLAGPIAYVPYVFRYYVFLARAPPGTAVEKNPDTYRWYKILRWFKEVGPKVEWQECGGSLITPNVVQTACHCISFYTRRPAENSGYHYNHATVMNIWEDRLYSYLGANEVAKMPTTPLVPDHYVVYEQCKQFIHHTFNVMDYGLIITKDSVVTRLPAAAISYAPPYKAADILKYYYKNVQVERMCLVIGHGQWLVDYEEDSIPVIQNVASEVQKWGWRTIMNRMDCESATFDHNDREIIREEDHADFDYAIESTWVCLQYSNQQWTRYRYLFGFGDSGGPVTCDGAYFAIVSMKQEEYGMAGPIAHTTFENAAEFRDSLIEEGSRKKRILLGIEAWETARDFYQSFRYYVFLAKAPHGTKVDENPKNYHFWKVTRWFQERGAKIEWQHCGGSLITPNVVQTACHCVSYFSRRPAKNSGYYFSHARAMNVWEDRIYSYVGANQIENMPLTMLVPKYYVVYEQCRQFIYHLQFSVMDFGLIITEDSVVKRVPKANISYAPVYKAADILKYYYKNVQVERMCLVIGHGEWNVYDITGDSIPLFESRSSEIQRWGWRTVMNSADCMASTFNLKDRRIIEKDYRAYFDYLKESTWVCLQHNNKLSRKWVYLFGGGDSGGPLTCDSAYFAVTSSKQQEISMAGPIAHTTFENAAEFRDNFMRWIDRFETDTSGESVNHITERIFVPTPEIYQTSESIKATTSFHNCVTLLEPGDFSKHKLYAFAFKHPQQ